MKKTHTLFVKTISAAVFLGVGAGACLAEDAYPSKAIRLVVPFATGGSADQAGRTLGRKLSERMRQPVIVENLGGAGGELGVNVVVRAPADGYTILVSPNGPITIAGLLKKTAYDVDRDLQPIGMVNVLPLIFAVNADLPVNTLSEFISYAKKNPNKVNYSNPGQGTAFQLNSELIRHATGITMTSVPYKGNGPAAIALASGEVQAGTSDFPSYLPFGPAPIGSGKIRFLATFSEKRAASLPDVPTVAEAGFAGFVPATTWIGMFVPAKTPKAIVDRLSAELDTIVHDPDVIAVLAKSGGGEPMPMSPAQFKKYIHDQIATLSARVKEAGIQLD